MARGVIECFIGLQNHNKNPNRRDTIQPDIWHRGSYPRQNRAHQPQEGVLCQTQQRRPIEAEPGLFERSQRSSLSKNGQVPAKDGRVLQSKVKLKGFNIEDLVL